MDQRPFKIAFDLDNTIVDYNRFFADVCQLKWGVTFDPTDMPKTRAEIPKVSNRRLNKLAREPFMFRNAPIIDPNIPSVIRELRDIWKCQIVIITHRYQYEGIQQDTKWWLNQYQIEYDWIAFTKEKHKVCLANDIDIMVDDHPDTIKECTDNSIRVFVPPHKYNEIYTDLMANVTRLPSHDWLYLLEQIKIEIEKRRQ